MTGAGLERLYEQPGLPELDLASALADRYGGGLGFPSGPHVVANFVATLDGVVALQLVFERPPLASAPRIPRARRSRRDSGSASPKVGGSRLAS